MCIYSPFSKWTAHSININFLIIQEIGITMVIIYSLYNICLCIANKKGKKERKRTVNDEWQWIIIITIIKIRSELKKKKKLKKSTDGCGW